MKYSILLTLQMFSMGLLSAQDLIIKDGIYLEKPLPLDTTKHKYSLDNISYKVNSVFIFDYYYVDKDGAKKKFLRTKNVTSIENPLNLVSYDNKTDTIIEKIRIEVDDYLEALAHGNSDYTQTAFTYRFLKRNENTNDTACEKYMKKKKLEYPCGDESTGIIDNKKNLFMHPPRLFTFRILQLNPFPFYYLDETVKTWSWNLTTAGFYLDPRWVDQQERITINFNYTRLPDETIETALGKLNCKVSYGTGSCQLKNGLLNTHLKSYYYPNYGFVRLEYENINGTKLVMQLIDAK